MCRLSWKVCRRSFLLLCEAQRPLPTHATAKREGLSIADLERHFDAVESQWGRRLALAALRGLVFSAAFPGCELPQTESLGD
jgi:hypothetical protein